MVSEFPWTPSNKCSDNATLYGLESKDMLSDLIILLCCVEIPNGTLSEFPWELGNQYLENVTL